MKYLFITLLALIVIGGGAFLLWNADTDSQDESQNEDDKEVASEEETEDSDEVGLDKEGVFSLLSDARSIGSLKYDVTIESDGETTSGTFWQKGENIKMEGEMEGQEMVSIVDNEEKVAYVYIPAQGIATKVDLGEVEEARQASMKSQTEEISDHDIEVLGEEVIDGKECVVIQYSDENTKTKTWIWKEHGLPVKIEAEGEDTLTIIKAESIEIDGVSDDVFELPDDVEITEMPTF
ncbi:MAG: DUF4412 domain-containing protein [Patescibacteria group bacterium]